MRKKLATARAVLHRPEVVFLDEPANGLDPIARAALHADIRGLADREGATVFLTTHDLADAERLCSRVAVIRSGRLIAVGAPDELSADHGRVRLLIRGRGLDAALAASLGALPSVEAARPSDDGLELELAPGASAAAAVRRAVEHPGAEVEEVTRRRSSLEDAFLALVGDGDGGAQR